MKMTEADIDFIWSCRCRHHDAVFKTILGVVSTAADVYADSPEEKAERLTTSLWEILQCNVDLLDELRKPNTRVRTKLCAWAKRFAKDWVKSARARYNSYASCAEQSAKDTPPLTEEDAAFVAGLWEEHHKAVYEALWRKVKDNSDLTDNPFVTVDELSCRFWDWVIRNVAVLRKPGTASMSTRLYASAGFVARRWKTDALRSRKKFTSLDENKTHDSWDAYEAVVHTDEKIVGELT